MDHIGFINISTIQFFDNTIYENEQSEDIEAQEANDDNQNNDTHSIEVLDHNNNEINIEYFDDKDEDTPEDSSLPLKIKGKVLNICPNTPITPHGNTSGVIVKIPVVLAQLSILLNISSSIDLPKKHLEIKNIKQRLMLQECILLQPTNVLFVNGFVNKDIEYSTTNCSNDDKIYEQVHYYKIDIPFECSTAVSFFTKPLEPTMNTNEILQYGEKNLLEFNQISEEFFNEVPFCKLLSSKIVESNRYLDSNKVENGYTKIQENMTIELKIEVLQNQPVVIPPSINNDTEI